jgi:hypothetical protein
MTARPIPRRHWRSYGTDPLPTGAEALDEPFRAFPSWFLRITCDRCGKDRMLSETHAPRSDLPIREIIKRMRHDGCGGRPGRVELLTGIEGASSRPVRRIVLLGALLATVLGLSIATPAAAADAPYLIGMGWSSCGPGRPTGRLATLQQPQTSNGW